MIEAKDLALFDIVDTVEEAWAKLVRRGLKSAQPPQALSRVSAR